MYLRGCTNSQATFSGSVYPGTYRVTVTGDRSDIPASQFVAIAQLRVP